MTLTPEEIRSSGNFRLIRKLSHDGIVEFIMEQLKKLRWPMAFFYGFNIMLIAFIIAFTAGNIAYPLITWGIYWQFLAYGLISGMLLIIPLHEMIHGIAYKLTGARQVKFGADLKQMLFYASAPGFVAGRYAFYLVAFSPFVFINLIFLAGIIYGTVAVQWASLVAIFVHSTMCIGDFAMVNFFASFPGRKIYTWDDEVKNTSYFFIKE